MGQHVSRSAAACLVAPADRSTEPAPREPESLKACLFWDYENVGIPTGFDSIKAARLIDDIVREKMSTQCNSALNQLEKRLYVDPHKQREFQEALGARSNLDLLGFNIINCPTRKKKETLDKKLVADMCLWVLEHRQERRTSRPCIVIISGDGDYAYALAKLRLGFGVFVIAISKDNVADVLLATADINLTWKDDVLRLVHGSLDEPRVGPERLGNIQEENGVSRAIAASAAGAAAAGPADRSSTSSEGNHLLFLRCLLAEQRQIAARRGGATLQGCMVADTKVATAYHKIKGFADTLRYRSIRQGLVAAGLVNEQHREGTCSNLELTFEGLREVHAAEMADGSNDEE